MGSLNVWVWYNRVWDTRKLGKGRLIQDGVRRTQEKYKQQQPRGERSGRETRDWGAEGGWRGKIQCSCSGASQANNSGCSIQSQLQAIQLKGDKRLFSLRVIRPVGETSYLI